MKKLLLAGLLILCLFSCKKRTSSLEANQLHQELKMTYENEETRFTAVIRCDKSNGRKLILNDGASITLNGTPMNGRKEQTSKMNGWLLEGTFLFNDGKGNSYQNTLQTVESVWPNGQYYFYKDYSDQVYWDGAPLGPNEEIIVYFEGKDDNNNTVSVDARTKQVGATFINMNSTLFNEFADDSYLQYYFERVRRVYTGNFSASGGSIISNFKSAKFDGQL